MKHFSPVSDVAISETLIEKNEQTCRVLVGDCIEAMRLMADQSVNCCVTSPPYFGLRDYGVEGQIGLEQRAPHYVENLVSVFAEVHRVLCDDGVLFVNLGDTYAGFKDGKFPPQSQSNGNQRSMPVSGAHTEASSCCSWMVLRTRSSWASLGGSLSQCRMLGGT